MRVYRLRYFSIFLYFYGFNSFAQQSSKIGHICMSSQQFPFIAEDDAPSNHGHKRLSRCKGN